MAVVGAGAIGSATARALARDGRRALLLEQFEVGHPRGSSRGQTRIFRHAYAEEHYVRLMQDARGAWAELELEAGERLVRTTGALNCGPGTEASAAAMAAAGVEHEWLDGSTAASAFPALDLAGVDRLLFHPDAGIVAADAAIRSCVRLAVEGGVVLRERTRVEAIEADGEGVAIRTGDGTVHADCVVVTAGAWSPGLLGSAGIAVDVAPSSTHVAYFTGAGDDEHLPVFVEHFDDDPGSYAYVVPSAGGSGVKVGRNWPVRDRVDPDARSLEPDPAVVALHAEYVRRRLPGLDAGSASGESCLYDMTQSEDFVLDRRGPIVVGTGFSGHGFKFMPLIGRLLAAAVDGAPLPEHFRLDRA
ncbi:MAG: FAD-dependent oxidoreductase [Actinomycetota bacterium]